MHHRSRAKTHRTSSGLIICSRIFSFNDPCVINSCDAPKLAGHIVLSASYAWPAGAVMGKPS